jgi:DHA1 family bicyclomycin/chloramphenicol resistance-like MFS transporter
MQLKPPPILAILLGALAMLGPFATDTYLPSFPAISHDFGVGEAEVQQTLSIYLFAYALMSLFWGTLSDSLGRRPIILMSLSLFFIGSVGGALSQGLPALLGFRALQGLSAGAGMVVGRAMVRDRLTGTEAQRLIAQIMMIFGLAPAVAPIFGGWLQSAYGWRSSFVFMALFSLTLILACRGLLSESLAPQGRQPLCLATVMRNYLTAIAHPHFLLRCLAIGCVFAGFGLYIASAADFVIVVLKLPATAFGWLFLPLIGGLVAGSMVSSRIAHRLSATAMVRAGFVIMSAATAGNCVYTYCFIAAVPWAVLPILVYTFGLALCTPSMSVMALDIFPSMRGLAASLQNFTQMLIFALMSGVVAPMLFGSALKLACAVALGVCMAAIVWRISLRSEALLHG